MAEATVGFADLVSFSALTNRLDDDEIGDLVEVFEGRSHDVVSRRGGRVVKTLGDSVLYMAATPAEGVEIAWDIVQDHRWRRAASRRPRRGWSPVPSCSGWATSTARR